MATTSRSLKTAVKKEVAAAAADAKTGDVETVKESDGGPVKDAKDPTDLPTGAHSRR